MTDDERHRVDSSSGRMVRILAVCLLLAILPGCIDLPDDTKDLLRVFTVLLAINIILNLAFIVLLVFYFFPFTRPFRRPRKRKRKR